LSTDEDENGTGHHPHPRRFQQLAWPVVAVGAVIGLAVGGLWVQRAPLAENLIERELAARGVRMSYRLVSVGLRTQRIENVVLGDPARPDLVARWVEVDIALGGLSPRIAGIRADGVRLRGVLRAGKVSLGELDKFMGEGTTTRALPDIDVALKDARATIVTDYGPLGLNLGGSGNLHSGFTGRVVAAMPDARMGQCGGQKLLAVLRVAMRGGEPRFTGPLTARALACPDAGLVLAAPHFDVDVGFDKTLSTLEGKAGLSATAFRAVGMTLGMPQGQLSAEVKENETDGRWTLSGRTLAGRGLIAGSTMVTGTIMQDKASHAPGVRVDGRIRIRDLAARGRDPLRGLRTAVAATPLAPLAERLSQAVRRAGQDNSLAAAFAVRTDPAGGRAALSDVHFAAASGARVDFPAGSRAVMRWPDGGLRFDGALTLGGGGLPDGLLRLRTGRDGGVSGRLDVAPYAVGRSRLALQPVVFSSRAGGSRFSTVLALDGPMADGAVSGLVMPLSGTISGKGALLVNDHCVPLRWRALRLSTLALDPAALRLCPNGRAMFSLAGGQVAGGVKGGPFALEGRLGSSPIQLRTAGLTAGVADASVQLRDMDVRIGKAEAPVILRAGRLDGRSGSSGFVGDFQQGSARIGTVPLDLSGMAGRWKFVGGLLDVNSTVSVADTQKDARFSPVRSDDAHLTLAGGRIAVTGHLRHPVRGNPFAKVDIVHQLSTGEGNAVFALDGLRFGPALQPDDLSPAALGVVANVEGLVEGGGRIAWNPNDVTSTAQFSTRDMNLAAAFGPVTGLSTTLRFTDLLALETAPGQIATVKSINPGIEVHDGRIAYQLLRGQQARIEKGEWPFSGGQLILLPGTLDLGAKRARHLVFRVIGLDAGAFINTLDLKNISATGTYDGLLPMIFDANGGRVEGGILVARQEGRGPLIIHDARTLSAPCDRTKQAGTLSYVGDVSNADLGTYGKLAFDALKHLRYKCLTILLDGAIDGEFVTQLAINGVNQGSPEAAGSAMTRPFLGLPFIFNVRITAPFRGLISTYQSFADPSTLIRNSLGPQYQSVLNNGLAVQPADSDKPIPREGE
jgi:translocation and assembly module TamB